MTVPRTSVAESAKRNFYQAGRIRQQVHSPALAKKEIL
jgi:hypothetical protein